MAFIDNIKKQAGADKKTIVLPETSDIRTLEAASKVLKDDFANIILIGNKDDILSRASGLDLNRAEIVDPKQTDLIQKYIDMFMDLRARKGMTIDIAKELLIHNPLYLGVALVRDKVADGMVAGAINATSAVLRAGLQIVGTAKDSKCVSSFFLMVVPDSPFGLQYNGNGVFVFSDCGLIQDPSKEELAQIAISSARSFKQLTKSEPKVALLSHSTYGSAEHAKIDKVRDALAIIKSQAPDLEVDGELQLDAALVPSIGKSKAPDSSIAGAANVLIFPDIDAGNIGYKLVQRLAKASAYGPVTQGMAQPINDLSRGCSSDDIVGTIAITSLQAQD